jgi:hypothetical protein
MKSVLKYEECVNMKSGCSVLLPGKKPESWDLVVLATPFLDDRAQNM